MMPHKLMQSFTRHWWLKTRAYQCPKRELGLLKRSLIQYRQQPNQTKMGYSRKWKKNVAKLSHDTINHQPIYALCSLPKLKAQCCNNHDSEEGSVSGNSQYSATDRESTHSGTLSHISSFGDSPVQDQEHRCSTPYVSCFDVCWTVLCGKRDNYLTLPPERDVWWYTNLFSTTAHKIENCLLTHFMLSCGKIQ